MDRFDRDGADILETALFGQTNGHTPTGAAFVLSSSGGWELVNAPDTPLDLLRRERSATAAFRLRQSENGLAVESSRVQPRFEFQPAQPYIVCNA